MFYIAWIVVTFVLTTATLFSALGKLRRLPKVVDSLHAVGVNDRQIVWLGSALLAGAFGLVMGVLVVPYLATLSAAALTVYFGGAWVAHWRVGDKAPVAPIVLFVLSAGSLVLGLL